MMDNNPSVGSQQAKHSQETQQDQDAICVHISDGATHAAKSFKFVSSLVTFVFYIVAAIVVLPLLLPCLLVTRFVQFIFALGYNYDKSVALKVIIKLKMMLRAWIYIESATLMCLLLVLYGVVQLVPQLGLKYAHFLGRSITYWIETYFIVFGIFNVSNIVSVFTILFVIFKIPEKYHAFQSSSHVVSDTVHETIDCVILLLLTEQVVVIRTPTLKQYNILGFYPIHRLLHLLILLLLFHNLIRLSVQIIVWLLYKLFNDPKKHPYSFRHLIATKLWGRESIVYWANGIKPSVMFTFTSLMLLLTWVCYVGPQIGGDHRPTKDKKVLNSGTCTCLCIFIFSLLWLIKTCILLLLEKRTIYNRFGPQISKGGKQLYLLGIIGRHNFDIFKIRYSARTPSSKSSNYGSSPKASKFMITYRDCVDLFTTKKAGNRRLMSMLSPFLLIKDEARYQHPRKDLDDKNYKKSKKGKGDENYEEKLSGQRKNQVRQDLLTQESDNSMIYELQKVVHYFLDAKLKLSQENYISTILQDLEDQGDDNYNGSIEQTLKRLTYGEIEHYIIERLIKDDKSQQSSGASKEVKHDDDDDENLRSFLSIQDFEGLKTWMETARNHCVFLANKLSSAKELVECLDRFMSVLIIVFVFILWLFLTKLATTKVFVVIGSPILAFSFIFGDATKTVFQGIVFVYLVHPFDVGDLCVIDGKMMEVFTIGVWKTTFSKVDTQEKVIYPNSDLLNKDIINHKAEFDWNDYVELYVDSTDKTMVDELINKIEKLIEDDGRYESTGDGVVMTAADGKIKLGVNFRFRTHQKKNTNYHECFKVKRMQRSEFVHKLLNVDNKEKENKGANNQEIQIE